MPYSMTAADSGLYRTTGIVAGNSDYTAIIRFKFTGNTGIGEYRTVLSQITGTYVAGAYTRWAGVFNDVGTQHYDVNVEFGSGPTLTTFTTLTAGTWYNIVYVRKGSLQVFLSYAAGGTITLIGSITQSASAFAPTQVVIGNDGLSKTNVEVAYFRDWSAALTVNELFNEFSSSRAQRTANLVSDCPLESDLLDKSGHGFGFTNQGTAGTFTTSVPTPNYTITSFPYSQVVPQATFNIANHVWFKYTAPTMIALGSYTNSGGTFTPQTSWCLADGVTLVKRIGLSKGQFFLIGPGDYYIKLERTGGTNSDFDFTTQFDIRPIYPNFDLVDGDLLVNDDTAGYSAAVITYGTGIKGFAPQIPAGEVGAGLNTGVTLWHDRFSYDKRLLLLDSTLTTLAEIDATPALGTNQTACCISATATSDVFYVLNSASGKLWKVTNAGVITDTGATLTATTDISAIGVNAAGSIAYYAKGSHGTKNIYQWDIPGNAALADLYATGLVNGLVAVTQNGLHGEILVLEDGSLVTWFTNTDTGNISTVIHVSSAGALLSSVTLAPTNAYVNHLSYAEGASDINSWIFTGATGNTGNFTTAAVATMTASSVFDTDLFGSFIDRIQNSATLFGPSNSCTMVTYLVTAVPPVTTTEEFLIRRERWFPVLSQEQFRMFFSMLQIDLQAGNGITVGQGENPILELDWSDDGGWTWSNLHLIETGRKGQYTRRAIQRQLGSGRDRVFRIAVSDPVQWAIINAYMQVIVGTS